MANETDERPDGSLQVLPQVGTTDQHVYTHAVAPHSVSIEVNAKGDVQFGVKVYGDNLDEMALRATNIFDTSAARFRRSLLPPELQAKLAAMDKEVAAQATTPAAGAKTA